MLTQGPPLITLLDRKYKEGHENKKFDRTTEKRKILKIRNAKNVSFRDRCAYYYYY